MAIRYQPMALPQKWADLRELIAAAARHDEAMAKRLGRLGEDLAF